MVPAPVEAFSPVTADTVADEPERNPMDANTALFEAVNAEIEKLQPRRVELENKEKLTVRTETENMTDMEAADFNSFSDSHIQKNK
ncbi:MAG: hypothetical protein EOO77_47605 [Oxalobacteraceae bacterium]|nr:MAG: hypothetical protein EOO77_47605 [Oxalobacteraceae bacterium]